MDVIESSKVKDRNQLTKQMGKAILKVNEKYKDDCYSSFEITKGDEIAAVLKTIKNFHDIIFLFKEILLPERIRTVIVFDELNAGLDSKRSSVIDGPAFHSGNSLMLDVKKMQKTFALKTGEKDWDSAIESLMNMLLWQWDNFTVLQKKIIRLYQKEKNQRRVAEKIKRTQQQVQTTLETCKWELIDSAELTLRDMFRIVDMNIKKTNSIR